MLYEEQVFYLYYDVYLDQMVVHCPQEAAVLHQYWTMIVCVEVGTVLHEGQVFYLCYDINLEQRVVHCSQGAAVVYQ